MRTDGILGCTPLINWDNFWLSYLNNLSVLSEQPELIPDPLVLFASMYWLADLGSDVVAVGFNPL